MRIAGLLALLLPALAAAQDAPPPRPASPPMRSTTILSPAATRYCLPPVRTTANMGFVTLLDLFAMRGGTDAART